MITETYTCTRCGSTDLMRNGKIQTGKQNFVAVNSAGIPAAYRCAHTYSDFWRAYQGVFGESHQSVGKETGQTAHIERWNNTLRQRLLRFVRKSLAFSKSDAFHRIALQLFIHEYNLACTS